METWMIAVIIGAGVICVIALGLAIAFFTLRRKHKRMTVAQDRVEQVKIVNGVRYTPSDYTTKVDGSVKASHTQKDFILERSKEYTVSKSNGLLPGKYTVLSADENVSEFNVRIAGFVRTLEHMGSVVLHEGDKIAAVSHTVILR